MRKIKREYMAINNLKNIIQNIINLPSLPSVTMEIISIIDNPDTDVQTLSKIIAKDQVLASKVLKVANSPFYSYPRVISTIDFAITILGFDTLKEVVISISFINYFRNYKSKLIDFQKFWKHSIISSIICRELAKSIKYKITGEAFVSGLIQDIGIFIMSQFFQNEFKLLVEKINNENVDFLKVEKEIYGFTHGEIGSWLLERWNFPIQLIEAVSGHHNPEISKINPVLTTLNYYTEYLLYNSDFMKYNFEKDLKFTTEYLNILQIKDLTDLNGIIEKNRNIIDNEIEKSKYFV